MAEDTEISSGLSNIDSPLCDLADDKQSCILEILNTADKGMWRITEILSGM